MGERVSRAGSSQGAVEGRASTPRELQEKAAAGSIWTAAHSSLAVPIAFTANAVIARCLGVSGYGSLAVLTMSLALIVQASHLAFSSGVIQWGSGLSARGRTRELDNLLAKSLGFHCLVQLPIVLVAIFVLARNESWIVQMLLMSSSALSAGFSSFSLNMTVRQRSATEARLAMGTNFVVNSSVAVVAAVYRSPSLVWGTRTIGTNVFLPLTSRVTPISERKACWRLKFPKQMPIGFWRYCLFAWASGLVETLVLARSEVFLLGVLSGAAGAGTFAIAFGIAAQVTAPADALLAPLGAAVAALSSLDSERMSAALIRAIRLSSLFAAAILTAAGPALFLLIPEIYGRTYSKAAGVFMILCCASCLQTSLNPLVVFTRSRGRSDQALICSLVGLIVDLVVAVTLIPHLGIWGAVAASVLSFAVYFMLLAALEVRHHGLGGTAIARASLALWSAMSCLTIGLALNWTLTMRWNFLNGWGFLISGWFWLLFIRTSSVGLSVSEAAVIVGALPLRLRRPGRWALGAAFGPASRSIC